MPRELGCEEPVNPTRCVIVLRRDDYRELVREIKAACLAGGRSPKECQAE